MFPAGGGGFTAEQPLGVYAVLPAGGVALSPSGEEIRTIFVTGFPTNVHERELHNLVCFLPGYEASQMNLKTAAPGTSPQGFALFTTPSTAQAAMLLLHDMPFDADCHLRCEMAHKNMYLKQDDPSIRRADVNRGQGAMMGGVMAGMAGMSLGGGMGGGMGGVGMGGVGMAMGRGPVSVSGMGGGMGGMMATVSPHMALTGAGGGHTYAAMGPHTFTTGPLLASTLAALRPTAVHHHAAGGGGALLPPGSGGGGVSVMSAAAAGQHAALMGNPTPVAGFGPVTNKFDNPPCNTLFIGNLGDTVDEGELTSLFACQPGYKQLKLLRHPRQVSCFVEFVDVNTAASVHSALQGALLTSSDRGPIRIQYSKNPYGKRSTHMGFGGGGYGGGPHSLSASSASSSAALFGAAAAAAVGSGLGGGGMVPASMANMALMAASAGGGVEFGGWSQQFSNGLMG